MAKFGSDVLGAWVLKCNPQMWDIVAFMADGNRVIDGWSVQDNVRAKNMVSGEPVVLGLRFQLEDRGRRLGSWTGGRPRCAGFSRQVLAGQARQSVRAS